MHGANDSSEVTNNGIYSMAVDLWFFNSVYMQLLVNAEYINDTSAMVYDVNTEKRQNIGIIVILLSFKKHIYIVKINSSV